MSADDRFWSLVDKTETCWLWKGEILPGGYGRIRRHVDGKMTRTLAHRHALALAGVDAGSLAVDHTCHNRACVNPDHLRIVTNKQNLENRKGANTNSKTGVRGVRWCKRRSRWIAEVRHNNTSRKRVFTSFEEACSAVVEMRNQLFTHNDVDRLAS